MDPSTDGDVERLVAVADCTSRVEAELKRGALTSDGVRAVVLTDDAGGAHPQLALLTRGAVRVAVPDHQADRARDVLADLDAGVHALPASGDHERLPAPRGATDRGRAVLAWVAGGLLAVLLAYRAVTMVWPGLG